MLRHIAIVIVSLFAVLGSNAEDPSANDGSDAREFPRELVDTLQNALIDLALRAWHRNPADLSNTALARILPGTMRGTSFARPTLHAQLPVRTPAFSEAPGSSILPPKEDADDVPEIDTLKFREPAVRVPQLRDPAVQKTAGVNSRPWIVVGEVGNPSKPAGKKKRKEPQWPNEATRILGTLQGILTFLEEVPGFNEDMGGAVVNAEEGIELRRDYIMKAAAEATEQAEKAESALVEALDTLRWKEELEAWGTPAKSVKIAATRFEEAQIGKAAQAVTKIRSGERRFMHDSKRKQVDSRLTVFRGAATRDAARAMASAVRKIAAAVTAGEEAIAARPNIEPKPKLGDTTVENSLEEWAAAKRLKDYDVADKIAAELIELGINPNQVPRFLQEFNPIQVQEKLEWAARRGLVYNMETGRAERGDGSLPTEEELKRKIQKVPV